MAALLAFTTRPYRLLSAMYRTTPGATEPATSAEGAAGPGVTISPASRGGVAG
ncbi:hypothetical protein [Microbacterium sp.]|uniref:hypothetical protein n=1 Tax=Microbacterium sp. TaxID=51671 RepID=UPI003A8C4A46